MSELGPAETVSVSETEEEEDGGGEPDSEPAAAAQQGSLYF